MTEATCTTKFFKIYLYRGFVGLPKVVREHARCLGLHKRFRTVYHPAIPKVAGNILKIKELVKVELVDSIPPPRVGPMYPKGYAVSHTHLPRYKDFKPSFSN